jgi:glutaconyl-CoA/methylmalonyl-CoA decarboxylase subunit gamma
MKYRVKVDEQWFEVEVGDIYARPVTATIDGETFEVWPESDGMPVAATAGPEKDLERDKVAPTISGLVSSLGNSNVPARPGVDGSPPANNNGASANSAGAALSVLRAPIPGVIVSVAVQPKDEVIAGQELCVLEAMKMKNLIRANRAGVIAKIHISAGQHVKHHDVLMEYAE